MQLPTSHENSVCRGDSGPNVTEKDSVDSWIRDPAAGERIKGEMVGDERREGRRGASKRVVCRLGAPLWGRERRPENGWGAARAGLPRPNPARCPLVPFSPHGATLKVITVASLILVILNFPSLQSSLSQPCMYFITRWHGPL